jgi:purine-cytosine permease-like protein
MASDDDTSDGDVAGAPYVPPGLRRSTFTPPTESAPTQPGPDGSPPEARDYDDDDLADALAEEVVRLGYSGPIQIVGRDQPENRIPPSELPTPSAPPMALSVDEPAAVSADEPAASIPGVNDATSFPAAPERRSLPDDELVRVLSEESLEPDGISSVFEKFQEHLRLREQEVREYRDWEGTMQAIGTPEALKSIEEVKTGFIEVIPQVTPTAPTSTVLPSPSPLFETPRGEPVVEEPDVVEESPAEEPPPSTSSPLSTMPAGHSRFAPPTPGATDFDSLLAGRTDEQASPGGDVEPLPSDSASELEIAGDAPGRQPIFGLEGSGTEPTPLEQRIGRSTRLFWLWFATNSSVLSVAFGGALFSLGMSLRQTIVSVFLGVAISFLPLGLGTLGGKWSGQPTMVISRAAFGLVGNVVPAILAVVVRLFWGAVLLWMIAASTARILTDSKLGGPFTEMQLTILAMAVGFVIALVVAFLGYGLFARIQLILTIVSSILLVGVVALTWSSVSISNALTVGDGPWILVVTGVVLVFSFIGLAWATSSADLARYQRPGTSGATSMLFASFGATLPAFLLIAYGSLLAASDPATARGLVTSPLDTIGHMLPGWYAVPLIAAVVLSLLSGVILSIYSGGFAIQSAGLRVRRSWATVLVGAVLFAAALTMTLTLNDVVPVFRDFATTLAVPIAAWAGIFAAEMMVRRRRFDSDSLLRRGGAYPTVNWVNLVMLIVASVIGLGLTTATVGGLGWEGYLFTAFGIPLKGEFAGTDLGVLVALLLGLLTPLVAGIPTIRQQELVRA